MEVPDFILSLGAFLFGALWGSFLNVCIVRIPLGLSVVRPGSHCFACQKPVRPWDNIPIISYFLLRGRCRECGAQFGGRHALVEFLTATLSVASFWHFALDGLPLPVQVARYLTYFAFGAVLIVLSFIDLDTKRLPDVITLPAIVVFFLAGFATGDVPWLPRLIGAIAGYGLVRIIADAYYYSTGREGLGLGDGKLLAVIGALLGWKALLPIVFSASFLGILISIPVLWAKRKQQAHQPPQKVAEPAPTVGESPAEAMTTSPLPAEAMSTAPLVEPSLRRTEVPFGPFLAGSAILYLFLHEPAWEFLNRFLLGG